LERAQVTESLANQVELKAIGKDLITQGANEDREEKSPRRESWGPPT
jgi:hypothetical protein